MVQVMVHIEDLTVKEFGCERICLHCRHRHVVELSPFLAHRVIVADKAAIRVTRRYEITLVDHVLRAFHLIVEFVVHEVARLKVRIEANSPVASQDKVDFMHFTFLLVHVAILNCCVKLAGHESECNLVDEIRV